MFMPHRRSCHQSRRLAVDFRASGLRADEERVIPDLHQVDGDGNVTEARMDLVVTRPGGVVRTLIDVRTVDGRAARAVAMGGTDDALRAANAEKERRYDGQAWPFAVESRGKIDDEALALLEFLAQEVALLSADGEGPCPGTLVRKWRRGVELVMAFELGESLRAADGRA